MADKLWRIKSGSENLAGKNKVYDRRSSRADIAVVCGLCTSNACVTSRSLVRKVFLHIFYSTHKSLSSLFFFLLSALLDFLQFQLRHVRKRSRFTLVLPNQRKKKVSFVNCEEKVDSTIKTNHQHMKVCC